MSGHEDARLIREQFVNWLKAVDALAEERKPPAPNAANGYFRDNYITSKVIWRPGKYLIDIQEETGPEGDTIAELYGDLIRGIRRRFKDRPNHDAHWATSMQAALPKMRAVQAEAIGVFVAIWALFDDNSGSDDQQRDEAQKDLAQALAELWNAIAKNKLVDHGTHMNGWISDDVRALADQLIVRIDRERRRQTITDPDLEDLLYVLRKFCAGIMRLPVEGHEPWLRAEWQLGFHALVKANLKALTRKPSLAAGGGGGGLQQTVPAEKV